MHHFVWQLFHVNYFYFFYWSNRAAIISRHCHQLGYSMENVPLVEVPLCQCNWIFYFTIQHWSKTNSDQIIEERLSNSKHIRNAMIIQVLDIILTIGLWTSATPPPPLSIEIFSLLTIFSRSIFPSSLYKCKFANSGHLHVKLRSLHITWKEINISKLHK